MENKKSGKFSEVWSKCNETVKPVIAWSILGGVFAFAIILALIIIL